MAWCTKRTLVQTPSSSPRPSIDLIRIRAGRRYWSNRGEHFCRSQQVSERRREQMSKENKGIDRGLIKRLLEADCEDPLASSEQLLSHEIPQGVDRRNFLIRSAVGGAAAVMMGHTVSAHERTARAVETLPQGSSPKPPLAADLNVVKKGQGPVLITADEFYKVGPGPSSSHTIGPMRIT